MNTIAIKRAIRYGGSDIRNTVVHPASHSVGLVGKDDYEAIKNPNVMLLAGTSRRQGGQSLFKTLNQQKR